MNRIRISTLICCFAFNTLLIGSLGLPVESAESAQPNEYPCIVGGPLNEDSQLVLKGVKLAFQSKQPKLTDAAKEVRAKYKHLVLWPTDEGGIDADTTEFDVSPEGSDSRKLCLQKKPFAGTRILVRDKYFNWQGDMFNVFLAKTDDPAKKIFEKFDKEEISDKPIPGYPAVMNETWQRPWVFKNPKSGKLLVVDTQHPAEIMTDWVVYEPAKDGSVKTAFKIKLRPPSQTGRDLLPKGPLLHMGILLDKIIGKPSNNEGTFHATDRLRIEVEQMWADVLYRPWAIAEPSSTRAQVDAYLKKWSKKAKSYHSQYTQLKALYPFAETALISYYQRSLGKTHDQAVKLAKKSLDLAYRSHFQL